MPVDVVGLITFIIGIFLELYKSFYGDDSNKKVLKRVVKETTKEFFRKYGNVFGSPEASFLNERTNVESMFKALFNDKNKRVEINYITDGFGIDAKQVRKGIDEYLRIFEEKLFSNNLNLNSIRQIADISRRMGDTHKNTIDIKTGIEEILSILNNSERNKNEYARQFSSVKIGNSSSEIFTQETEQLILGDEIENSLIKCINDYFRNAEYEEVLSKIDSIISYKDRNVFSIQLIEKILCIKGRVLINTGQDGVMAIVNELKLLCANTRDKYIFFGTVGTLNEDSELLDISIKWLETNEPESGYYKLFSSQDCLYKKDYFKAIQLISTDKGIVIPSLSSNSMAYEILGKCYASLDQYEQAIPNFEKSFELSKTPLSKYLLLKSRVLFIIRSTIINEHIDKLTKYSYELLDLEKVFCNLRIDVKLDYHWTVMLSLLFVDSKKLVDYYHKLDLEAQQNIEIMKVYSEGLQFIGEIDEALNVSYQVLEKFKNANTYANVFSMLYSSKKYSEMLDLYKAIDFNVIEDKDGVLPTFPIDAYIQLKEYDQAIVFIDSIFDKFKNCPIFLICCADLYTQLDDEEYNEKVLVLLETANGLIDSNDIKRIDYARKYLDMRFENEALSMLKPLIEISSTAKAMYIHIEAMTAYENERYSIAFEKYVELFQINRNHDTGNNLVRSAILGNFVNRVRPDVIEYLKDSNIIGFYPTISAYYEKLGDYYSAEKQLFLAFINLKGEINEYIYLSYINLITRQASDNPDSDRVRVNTCVQLLGSENDEKWIGIYNDYYIDDSGIIAFNCRFYKDQSQVSTILINKQVGEIIRLWGKEYEIKSILKRDCYCFRKCLEIYTNYFPNSPYFKVFNIDKDDPLKQITPMLFAQKKSIDEALSKYNFSNGTGLSINALSILLGNDYFDTILYLIHSREQTLYTYDIKHLIRNDSKIVLSASSLLVLASLDILDLLNNKNIYLHHQLQTMVDRKFTDAISNFNEKAKGKLTLINGIPRIIETTDEDKKSEIDFIRKLKLFCESVNIVSLNELKDYNKDVAKLLGDFDYESAIIANYNGYIFVNDDLFTGKAIDGVLYPDNNFLANSVDLIMNMIKSVDDKVKAIYKLSEYKYLKYYDSDYLVHLITELSSKPLLLFDGYKHITTILNNSIMLPHKVTEEYYLSQLIKSLDVLYSNCLDPSVEQFLLIIARTIKRLFSNKSIDIEMFLSSIDKVLKFDPKKASYIRNLFNRV